MLYWKTVLNEVLNKNQPSCLYTVINRRDDQTFSGVMDKKIRRRIMKTYALGSKYPGVAFTRREAECMVQLLKGKTITKVAVALSLSARTIEFYLKNMKAKLDCRTKSELIGKVVESDFMQHVDFEYP